LLERTRAPEACLAPTAARSTCHGPAQVGIEVTEHGVFVSVAQKVSGLRVAVNEAAVGAVVEAGDTGC